MVIPISRIAKKPLKIKFPDGVLPLRSLQFAIMPQIRQQRKHFPKKTVNLRGKPSIEKTSFALATAFR